MTRKALLVAGVFSLFLGGTWGNAQARETSDNSKDPQGVFSLLGKTVCLAHAPPSVDCDWDFRASEKSAQTAKSFSFFGKRFCVGGTADEACDVHVPLAAPTPASKPKVLHLLGVSFCLGDGAAGVDCDVTLPKPAASHG